MMMLYQLMPWSVLALRLALGAIFLVHGSPKMKNSQAMAGGMGMSASKVWLIGLIETLAAISMIAGLFTHIGAIAIMVIMIGALYYKIEKWHVPFTAMDKTGWEFDLIILAAAFAMATIGAGTLSVDWLILGMY